MTRWYGDGIGDGDGDGDGNGDGDGDGDGDGQPAAQEGALAQDPHDSNKEGAIRCQTAA